jgi:signal transduction histidine kinase
VVIELPRHPVRASVDGPRLERALVNLLSNAQRYAPRGGTIQLRLERRRGEVVLSVSDDGPGISHDEQARIFERLYRGPGGGMHRGSGLGLPIARAMVELHHGRMWVESTPGAGATFFVALPLPRQHRLPA